MFSFIFSADAYSGDVAKTSARTVEITTYEQLVNYAKNAQSDVVYVLANDIYQKDNQNDFEVVVDSWSHFTLDLNGYSISRITTGNDVTLFRIKSSGYMKIMDTSLSKTGTCTFSEGYSTYYKSVFNNQGGELEIINGYYEILSPYEQGDCCVLRTTSGFTNIYGGTFDSSLAYGGDTISVGYDAYFYDTPCVTIFDGDFYGKYQSIDVSPMDNFLKYGKEYPNGSLHPYVFVLGGNFFICNGGQNGEWASFAYCNNDYGRVIVAEGTVLAKCLNASDQRFLDNVSKKFVKETIDDYNGTYYEVTAPPMIMSDDIDYYYRLINLCYKNMVNSYSKSVHEIFKEPFDAILENIDTIVVDKTEKTAPHIRLENRTKDHKYVRWYMCDEKSYNGEDTEWTHLSDYDDVSEWQPENRPEKAESYLVRCVVTNPDLSTYEDIIRISYESTENTLPVIYEVEVNGIEKPVAGNTPDMTASVLMPEEYFIEYVVWYDITQGDYIKSTDKFIAGHKYRVDVALSTHEGYVFNMCDGYNETYGFINGQNAIEFGSHEENFLEIGYEFGECKEEKPQFILGDVDMDKKISVMDATSIQMYKALMMNLSEDQLTRADTDKDSKVSVMDATKIQMLVAQLIDSF